MIKFKTMYKSYDHLIYIYNHHNNPIYIELGGMWVIKHYDKNNNEVYWEDSDGYWIKKEYDKNNNKVYWEDSKGLVIDRIK